MRTIKLLVVIITNALIVTGCDEQQNAIPKAKWTWKDTDRSFEEIEIKPGTTIDVILEIPDPPYEYAFRVITPQIIDEVNGNALVLSLHGGVGGAGREAHKSTQCIEPVLERINAFILSPNADKAYWYELYNQEKIVRTLNMAIEHWPINTSKMVITGYSDGGNGTWFFAEAFPNAFSAGIALASSYQTLGLDGKGRKIETPLYVIHSSGDELFPLDSTQYWVNKSIEAGSDITFVVADGLSHYRPCDYTGYLEDGIQWLLDDVW